MGGAYHSGFVVVDARSISISDEIKMYWVDNHGSVSWMTKENIVYVNKYINGAIETNKGNNNFNWGIRTLLIPLMGDNE